jgi:acetoin utilization protein AcuB
MRVTERMSSKPTSVSPRDTLAAAKALMDAEGFHRLPVLEAGRLVGILSERDLRMHWGYLDSTRVDAAMKTDPMFVSPETGIEDAARIMLRHTIGALPVVDKGKLVGIITTTDILKAFLDVMCFSQEGLRG